MGHTAGLPEWLVREGGLPGSDSEGASGKKTRSWTAASEVERGQQATGGRGKGLGALSAPPPRPTPSPSIAGSVLTALPRAPWGGEEARVCWGQGGLRTVAGGAEVETRPQVGAPHNPQLLMPCRLPALPRQSLRAPTACGRVGLLGDEPAPGAITELTSKLERLGGGAFCKERGDGLPGAAEIPQVPSWSLDWGEGAHLSRRFANGEQGAPAGKQLTGATRREVGRAQQV